MHYSNIILWKSSELHLTLYQILLSITPAQNFTHRLVRSKRIKLYYYSTEFANALPIYSFKYLLRKRFFFFFSIEGDMEKKETYLGWFVARHGIEELDHSKSRAAKRTKMNHRHRAVASETVVNQKKMGNLGSDSLLGLNGRILGRGFFFFGLLCSPPYDSGDGILLRFLTGDDLFLVSSRCQVSACRQDLQGWTQQHRCLFLKKKKKKNL